MEDNNKTTKNRGHEGEEKMKRKNKKSKNKAPPHTVEMETVEYFKRIESIIDEIDQKFESDEDKEVFFDNVMKEFQGKELKLCQDPECSPILEKFIRYANEKHIVQFFEGVAKFLSDLCFHKNGSHVIQTLFCSIPFILEASENPQMVEKAFLDSCDVLLESWFDLTFDFYGSHILRAVLNVLSGQKVDSLLRSSYSQKFQTQRNNDPQFDKASGSKKNTLPIMKTHLELSSEVIRKTPQSFEKKLKSIMGGILEQSDKDMMPSMALDNVASPVLQLLLFINSKNEEVTRSLIDKILYSNGEEESDQNEEHKNFFKTLIRHQVGSRVAEAIIYVCPQDLYLKLFDENFHGDLSSLVNHPISNYVVGTLIHYVKNESQLGIIVDEIEPFFDRLLHHDRVGIVQHMVSSCVRLHCNEKKIFQMICKGLNASSSDRKDLVRCVVYLQKADLLEKSKKVPQNHGSAIAQGLFMFPIAVSRPLVDSFLNLPSQELVDWCKDQHASHTIEAFLSSKTIDLPSKVRLLKKLKGYLVEIAITKFGSHVIDSLWQFSDIGQKEGIVAELAEKDKELQNNFHGKFVYRNCRVATYKQKKDDWVQKEMSSLKKKEMFKEIVEPEVSIEEKLKSISGEDPNMAKLGYQTIKTAQKKDKNAKKSEPNFKVDDGDDSEEEQSSKPEKRKRYEKDEIDDLFKGKRVKTQKDSKNDSDKEEKEEKAEKVGDKSVQVVLEAIEATSKKKKKSKKEEEKKEKVKEKVKRELVLKESKKDKTDKKEKSKKFSMN